MHPVERILLSVGMSVISFLFIRNSHLNWELTVTVLWDAFAFSFILTSWVVFFTRPVAKIIQQANKDDGSRGFVMISIIVSSFASMFTVLLIMISKDTSPDMEVITVLLSITGMILSWTMVHTIFTFHYAHLYYDEGRDDTPGKPALDFPGENNPDYLDFAYFAFVIGTTFQVSDVEIHSKTTRRTVLAHGLLAFALNTFVVALTINLIAGLKG
ncbi:MAG: putative rane protein [Ferruginibacter sp.]|nr:putative rane protein [Ferruginibacter sp.]